MAFRAFAVIELRGLILSAKAAHIAGELVAADAG
jgi:hypothetical protein